MAFTGWANGPTIGFKLGGAGEVPRRIGLWLEKQTERVGFGVVVDGHVLIVSAGPGTVPVYRTSDRKDALDGATRRRRKLELLVPPVSDFMSRADEA